MLENGHIKLYRSMLNWEWFTDRNTLQVFLFLLLTANYKEQKWRGISVKRGQCVTSYAKISIGCGLTVNCVRTAIKHLISTGEITHQPNAEYGLFTVSNYDKYQDPTPEATPEPQSAHSQPTVEPQSINNNGRKLIKLIKKKKEYIPPVAPQDEKTNKPKNTKAQSDNEQCMEMLLSSTLSDNLKSSLSVWLAYKTERGDSYKKTGFKSFLTEVSNRVERHGEQAVCDVIRTSMANCWKGIIWDKIPPPPQVYITPSQLDPASDKHKVTITEGMTWEQLVDLTNS